MKKLNEILFSLISPVILGEGVSSETAAVDERTFRAVYALAKKHDIGHLLARGVRNAECKMQNDPLSRQSRQLSQGASQIKPLTSGEVAPKVTERVSVGAIHESPDSIASPTVINTECEMQNYGAVGVGGLVATSVTSGSECPPDIHSIPSVSLRYSTTHIVGRGLAPAALIPKGEPCPLTAIAELSQGASQIKPLTSGEVAPKVTERESQGAIHESHDGVAKAQGGSYERFLTPEHFYFYHVAHMAAHMRNGGCGIRPFIDLYLIRRNMPCERAVLDGMLSEYGLARFEAASVALAERWMCADTLSRKCKMQNVECKTDVPNAQMQNAECKMQNLCADAQMQNGGLSEEQLSAFEEYVLTGGVYGSGEQYVAAKQRGGKQGKAKYVLGRIFMPYEQLKLRHPRLDGHRWLTPVFEVYRWCSLVVPSRLRRSGKELSSAMRVDNAKVTSVEELLDSLEL